VNFAGLFSSQSPEERRQRLEAFKKSAPENALANYLSAQEYFSVGQSDQAVQELMAANGKSNLQDYSLDFVQNAEEAYRAAGYSEAAAKAAAGFELPIPQFARLKQLGQQVADLAQAYHQAGDDASAQAALQIGLELGRRLDDPRAFSLIQNLVGVGIQRSQLSAMNPTDLYGSAEQTVQNHLDTLAQRGDALRAALPMDGGRSTPVGDVLMSLSDSDLAIFFDRMRASGQWAAVEWARHRQTGP
jgi:tetratricopeptide (TPR) repeat protein